MANTIRDPNREKVWRQTLTQHAKSGLTVRQFCRREGLHESAFYF
jgi:transposase